MARVTSGTKAATDAEYRALVACYSRAARGYAGAEPAARRGIADEAAVAARALQAHVGQARGRALYGGGWAEIAGWWEARR